MGYNVVAKLNSVSEKLLILFYGFRMYMHFNKIIIAVQNSHRIRQRLEKRADKPSIKEIELRLNRFDYEESKISAYDYVIKNNNLEKTVQIIMTIIENEYKMQRTV